MRQARVPRPVPGRHVLRPVAGNGQAEEQERSIGLDIRDALYSRGEMRTLPGGLGMTVVAACVTLTVWPPIVTVADLGCDVWLAAANSCTEALPDPLADAAVSHAALEPAVHAHPVGADTDTVVVPPSAVKARVAGDTA
jgi:hypothetical protein